MPRHDPLISVPSGDWAPGDLALCVVSGFWWPCPVGPRSGWLGKVDGIYRGPCPATGEPIVGLVFDNLGRGAFAASGFRKIHPHAPDAEDQATIALLDGVPRFDPAAHSEWSVWTMLPDGSWHLENRA